MSIRLLWRGPRFPAFLCLGIALLLLLISVPIVRSHSHSWFRWPGGIALVFSADESDSVRHCVFLLTQRRTIEIDPGAGRLSLRRQKPLSVCRLYGDGQRDPLESPSVSIASTAVSRWVGRPPRSAFQLPALRLELSSGETCFSIAAALAS